MHPKRKQKLFIILGLMTLAALAIGLTLYALRSNINLFFSPVQVAAGEAPVNRTLRAGGMVKENSVARDADSLDVTFVITDYVEDLEVRYSGILPDLFREGQGVVVVGKLDGEGHLMASEVLAKHDENYMPREVADALKAAGYSPADYSSAGGDSAPKAGSASDAAY
ncbi:cytochrome c-type biogenesis protein CcmE [Onishia taeanensis]|uniref:Cytochrome c-type biogenesis protein CcmE n=1 Tax=Onishia taeanensis TaxID=284577 RepID=A0A1G7P4X2_9GAMM|nr:cytochrome c maturation protein CcmE [Halomonas taeanensis]MAX32076.1 cytochrome c maturation protein CcmE [Halomonadaceae bacterium]SDF81376.1 cytochrome c-type biogenesis protein CcmE [Halomonas taeanensis]